MEFSLATSKVFQVGMILLNGDDMATEDRIKNAQKWVWINGCCKTMVLGRRQAISYQAGDLLSGRRSPIKPAISTSCNVICSRANYTRSSQVLRRTPTRRKRRAQRFAPVIPTTVNPHSMRIYHLIVTILSGVSKALYKTGDHIAQTHKTEYFTKTKAKTATTPPTLQKIAKLWLVLKMEASFPYLDLRKHQELRNPTKLEERLGSVFASGFEGLAENFPSALMVAVARRALV
ncbi:hypothetical protein VNO80_25637 [Phaseolus coccineus]|uniref:Uncharacterized protein n=1 Tax=Phaseolus coccineus TaxID=3886 RepID=A0AAN9QQA9_PHACN